MPVSRKHGRRLALGIPSLPKYSMTHMERREKANHSWPFLAA